MFEDLHLDLWHISKDTFLSGVHSRKHCNLFGLMLGFSRRLIPSKALRMLLSPELHNHKGSQFYSGLCPSRYFEMNKKKKTCFFYSLHSITHPTSTVTRMPLCQSQVRCQRVGIMLCFSVACERGGYWSLLKRARDWVFRTHRSCKRSWGAAVRKHSAYRFLATCIVLLDLPGHHQSLYISLCRDTRAWSSLITDA